MRRRIEDQREDSPQAVGTSLLHRAMDGRLRYGVLACRMHEGATRLEESSINAHELQDAVRRKRLLCSARACKAVSMRRRKRTGLPQRREIGERVG